MNRVILLAEDNSDDVFFMQRAVKACGIAPPLQVATNGQAVIDYLEGTGEYANREQYPIPFLIFLDLKMPHRSGLEVLEWIRQQRQFQTMLVLILTTSREETDVQRAYRLGANSYLVKPPNASQLTELIRLVKAYWLDNPQLAISPPSNETIPLRSR
jgi:CheY-like chemotaxis protein